MLRSRQGMRRGGLAKRLFDARALEAGLGEAAGDPTRVRERDNAHLRRGRARECGVADRLHGLRYGVIVPGTGIQLNNMLGEYDLAPGRPVA